MTCAASERVNQHLPQRLINVFHGIALLMVFSTTVQAGEKPIYGTDDRNEILYSDAVACRAALSTVAILPRSAVKKGINDRWKLQAAETLGDKGWCADERFSDQLSVVACSGFLIANNRVVTAAHCINAADDPYGPGLNCDSAVFVFDYKIADDGELPLLYRSDQVRTCEVVLDGEEITGGPDWRVIQLDQPVARNALAVLNSRDLPAETGLMTVVGHPLGLPMKSARNGTLRKNTSEHHFVLNIDSYEGNSGSGVIASVRGVPVVVGMLTSGSKDFVYAEQSCKRSKICEPGQCRGETATRASAFSGWAGNAVTLQTLVNLTQSVPADSCS